MTYMSNINEVISSSSRLVNSAWVVLDKGEFWYLYDQGGFIITREEWKKLKTKVDSFFDKVTDEEINLANQQNIPSYYHSIGYDENYEELNTKSKKKKKKKKKSGFVYMIYGVGTPFYKIGQSVDPESRLNYYTTSLPFRLVIKGMYFSDDAIEEEKKWLKKFELKQIRSEWFDLNEEDVSEFLDYCENRRDNQSK